MHHLIAGVLEIRQGSFGGQSGKGKASYKRVKRKGQRLYFGNGRLFLRLVCDVNTAKMTA
tara:strand:+ start:100 stop:279 length:180 start_codon:yes stop_codon:yes gene_type:complete